MPTQCESKKILIIFKFLLQLRTKEFTLDVAVVFFWAWHKKYRQVCWMHYCTHCVVSWCPKCNVMKNLIIEKKQKLGSNSAFLDLERALQYQNLKNNLWGVKIHKNSTQDCNYKTKDLQKLLSQNPTKTGEPSVREQTRYNGGLYRICKGEHCYLKSGHFFIKILMWWSILI